VPVAGNVKGANKLVWSKIIDNKQQISETHFFKNTKMSYYTIRNLYSTEKDAILSISQSGGHSVFQGSGGVSAYVLA